MAPSFTDIRDELISATKHDLKFQNRLLNLLTGLYTTKADYTILVMKLTMLCQDLGVSNQIARKILQWIDETKR